MNNLIFTNMGRIFIKTGNCSGYTYLGTADLSGLSTSFGESTYIYKPSDVNVEEYEILTEIKPQNTNTWTTSLTMYLDMDSASLLLDLAKRRCSFSLQVHYGSCINPTEFSDFQTGFLLENVTISDYSTGQLTARSPDARGIIEETVSLTATNVYQLFTPGFTEEKLYDSIIAQGMGLFALDTVPNLPCEQGAGSNCDDNCNIVALGVSSGNSIYTVSRFNSNWYSNRLLVSGLTDATDPGTVIYNGTTAIFLIDSNGGGVGSTPNMVVYTLKNSELQDNTLIDPPQNDDFGGALTFGRRTYLLNNKLYIAANNIFNNDFAVGIIYDIAKGSLIELDMPNDTSHVLRGVYGRGNNIFFYGTGYLVYYNAASEELINLSSLLPVANKNVNWVNVVSRTQFYINIRNSATAHRTYCTENGGYTWTLVGNAPEEFEKYEWQNTEIGYAIGVSGTLYETFDGGVTWKENPTLFTLDVTDVSICNENITITESNSARNDSLIAEN